jgi:hypothetical protein
VPAALVFHMSHCGSTLVAQMVKAMAQTVVISESALIDDVVWVDRRVRIEPSAQADLLRAAAAALVPGQRTNAALVLKLHATHALRLPLFARAFPGVPWIFVHRDPVEVLVAQARLAGPELIPGVLPAEAVGVPYRDAVAMPPLDWLGSGSSTA